MRRNGKEMPGPAWQRQRQRMATATDGIAKIGDGKALLWKHSNGKAWRGFVLQRQGMTLYGKGIATKCFALQRLGITWLGDGMA